MECRKVTKKDGNKEHHLWSKRDSAGSGQKALNLVRIVCLVFHFLLFRGLLWSLKFMLFLKILFHLRIHVNEISAHLESETEFKWIAFYL